VKIVVTGSGGLLGWHAAARLHARNCAARFQGAPEPFKLMPLDRAGFSDRHQLNEALSGAEAVLHFAGVNRSPVEEIEGANVEIGETLVQGCRDAGVVPHIVYANSTHAAADTPYGRSKRRAAETLEAFAPRFTNLVLPHIFGECAKPDYNNVTATFIDRVIHGRKPSVDPDGIVHLLHAGTAAEAAIDAASEGLTGAIYPEPRAMAVADLLAQILRFYQVYRDSVYPDLRSEFDRDLFNTYRAALYPQGFPRPLALNADPRGVLFEAVKGGGGGQTFLSWTEPGVTRGDHFHLNKVERFLALDGEAVIEARFLIEQHGERIQHNIEAFIAIDVHVDLEALVPERLHRRRKIIRGGQPLPFVTVYVAG